MHCSCGVSHFRTYIAHFPQLLHTLITLIGLLGWCLTLVWTVWPPPQKKSPGIPGQRHVKAIRQKVSEVFFSGHWGESKRLQRSVTKTGRCCGSVLCPPPPPTHTDTQTHRSTCAHTYIHRQTVTHGLTAHTYNGMRHIQREYEVKNKHTQSSLSMSHSLLSLNITSLSAPFVPSRASSY